MDTQSTERSRTTLEASIRESCTTSDFDRAATLALEGYGPEILGFLRAMMRSESDADDVFSEFCENVWRGLPTFSWRSSVRTWAYTLARHAASRYRRSPGERARRSPGRRGESVLERVEDRVRTATLPMLRTENKSRITALRETLPADDQALLILRVDKALEWNDLAKVMLGRSDDDVDAVELRREAARLRKRFQFVKERLRELAEREGLLGEKP